MCGNQLKVGNGRSKTFINLINDYYKRICICYKSLILGF